MARPFAESKLGFFPIPPPVAELLLKHLEAPDPGACTILDPCAGKGEAIGVIANGLGVAHDSAYCVELAESRSKSITETFGDMHLLGPASFHGTEISYNSFSLVYVNPPYSSEMGGGRREELSFLVRAINLAAPGGVVALVVPEATVLEWSVGAEAMRRAISCRLADVTVWKPPHEHRQYRETIVLGVKRKQPLPIGEGPLWGRDWHKARDDMQVLGTPGAVYRLPPGKRPKLWRKVSHTPAELARKMAESPLAGHLGGREGTRAASPPLPPGRGHVALILAAGDLDGLVWPEGEPPHVVRGTATKVSYRDEAKCEEKVNDDGSTSMKDVWSERIVLVVRAIALGDGVIRTFTDQGAEACPSGETSRPG